MDTPSTPASFSSAPRSEVRCCSGCGRFLSHAGVGSSDVKPHVVWSVTECERCRPKPPPPLAPKKPTLGDVVLQFNEMREIEKILADVHPGTRWYLQYDVPSFRILLGMDVLDLITKKPAATHRGEIHVKFNMTRHSLIEAIAAEAERMVNAAPTTLL